MSGLLGGAFAATAGAIGQMLFWFVVVLVFGLGAVLALRLFVGGGGSGRGKLKAFIIDPWSGTVERVDITRISDTLFRTKDGDLLIVPTDAKPLRYKDETVYIAVRVDGRPVHVEPGKLIEFSIIGRTQTKTSDIAELLAVLASQQAIPLDVKLTPNVTLAISVDTRSVARAIAEAYDRTIEDAISGMVSLTESRRSFQEMLKLYAAVASAVGESKMKIIAIIAIAIIALAVLLPVVAK